MKWLFLVTFTFLAVSVFSAAVNKEEDASLKELLEDEMERADGTETGEGQGRFVRETKEELEDVEAVKEDEREDEREDEPEMAKTYLTENDDTENDESEDTSPELDEKKAPIDIKADFDANKDMDIKNETPEQ